MTRETAQKLLLNIEHIKAFADGAIIENMAGTSGWTVLEEPSFTGNPNEYRIKPREPVIAKYNSIIGSSRLAFHPGAKSGVDYTFIEMTPEVAEAVKHLIPKQILTDETP